MVLKKRMGLLYNLMILFLFLTTLSYNAYAVEKNNGDIATDINIVKDDTVIKGETFFSISYNNPKYKDYGKFQDTLIKQFPAKINIAKYSSMPGASVLLVGVFTEKETTLAWTQDHRRLWLNILDGFNTIYFDNATKNSLLITLNGKKLPILESNKYGLVEINPNRHYKLEIRLKEGNTVIVSRRILIENAGKSNHYIFNIDAANIYTVKSKLYQ